MSKTCTFENPDLSQQLLQFARREDALVVRRDTLGLTWSQLPARLRAWRGLIGDKEIYLHEYQTWVEAQEKKAQPQAKAKP